MRPNMEIGVLKFAVKILEKYLCSFWSLKPAILLKMNFLIGIFQGFDCKIDLVAFKAPIFKKTSFPQNTSSDCFRKKYSGTPSPDFFCGNRSVKNQWYLIEK